MTHDDIQHSGSRWEPTPGGTEAGRQPYGMPGPGQAAVLGDGEQHAGAPYAATATALPPEPPVATAPRGSLSGKGLLATIAAGFLVLGGVGGYAVGNATAGGNGSGTSSVQNGLPGTGGVTGGGPGVGGEGIPFGGHGRFDDGDGDGAPVPGDGSGGTSSGGTSSGGNSTATT